MQVGQIHRTMGARGAHQSELIFEDCVVPAENVIGQVGQGFSTAMKTLDDGRVNISAFCVGCTDRLLHLSKEYANQRVQFGKPIAERQAIQWMLADMATEIYAARMMVFNAAWRIDRQEKITREAAMIKLFATEMVGRAADKALQIHGGMGYMKECVVERIYRDVRYLRFIEGTSEIQRMIIARDVLKS